MISLYQLTSLSETSEKVPHQLRNLLKVTYKIRFTLSDTTFCSLFGYLTHVQRYLFHNSYLNYFMDVISGNARSTDV